VSGDASGLDIEERLLEAGELLLNGWGYNWYRRENLMRADDILLRNHAEQLLGEAEAAMQSAAAAFRSIFLPPPSRENPLPDPQHLAQLRAFVSLLAELDAIRTAVRGAAMPPDDKIWRRHRDEHDTLAQLARCDALIAGASAALRTEAALTGPGQASEEGNRFRAQLAALQRVLTQRRALLAVPFG
jgi:hypothetical protein